MIAGRPSQNIPLRCIEWLAKRSSNTYGGRLAVMASAVKNLEIIERENLVENSDLMGSYF